MRSYRLAALAVLLACGPTSLPAQSASFSAGGLYAALNGSDFDGINPGLGGELQFRYHTARGFSIGGGVQYTSHGLEGFSENFGVRAFFADARYAFAPPSSPSVKPYLGFRAALAHYGISSGGTDITAYGTAFGPLGGLLIQLGSTTQLDVGLAWFSVNFGNFSVNGAEQADTKASGSALAVRAGVVVGFGKK
jgi:hypothetical protein